MDDDDAGTDAVMLELRALRSSGWPATSPGCMYDVVGRDGPAKSFSGNAGWGCAPCSIANLFLGPAVGRSDLI
jgi:hypothetical protein